MSPSSSTTRLLPFAAVAAACGSNTVSGIHRLPLRLLETGRGFRPGKLDVKARTASRTAKSFNTSSVLLNDSVTHRKPQARALARALGGEERIVNAVQILGGNAVAGVDHVHECSTFTGGRLHFQHSTAFHRVAGIEKQVQKYLLELSRVALDGRESCFERCAHFHAG